MLRRATVRSMKHPFAPPRGLDLTREANSPEPRLTQRPRAGQSACTSSPSIVLHACIEVTQAHRGSRRYIYLLLLGGPFHEARNGINCGRADCGRNDVAVIKRPNPTWSGQSPCASSAGSRRDPGGVSLGLAVWKANLGLPLVGQKEAALASGLFPHQPTTKAGVVGFAFANSIAQDVLRLERTQQAAGACWEFFNLAPPLLA
jgi:hypothetical protein